MFKYLCRMFYNFLWLSGYSTGVPAWRPRFESWWSRLEPVTTRDPDQAAANHHHKIMIYLLIDVFFFTHPVAHWQIAECKIILLKFDNKTRNISSGSGMQEQSILTHAVVVWLFVYQSSLTFNVSLTYI